MFVYVFICVYVFVCVHVSTYVRRRHLPNIYVIVET